MSEQAAMSKTKGISSVINHCDTMNKNQRSKPEGSRRMTGHSNKNTKSIAVTANPLTDSLRNAKRSMRAVCSVAIFTLVHAILFPHLAMAQDGLAQQEASNQIVLQGTPEQQMNQALLKVQEIASTKQTTIAERIAGESDLLDSVLNFFGLSQLQLEELDNLQQLNGMLAELNQTAIEQFDNTEQQLLDKGLPPEILQRHTDTVAHYQQQFYQLSVSLNQALQADGLQAQGEAIDALNTLMAPQKLKKRHQTLDPNKLPWGTPDASKTRQPAQTTDELSQQTGISPLGEGILLAANTLPDNIFDQLGGPQAQDLAETPDIQLTDAIRDLAENQLNDDPVAIYNWVRNNIEYIPSYGSIQGADYTLQHGKGNAFDTASLLIALYRAANIPARYAYGTVRVPVDKVMNWVGGVEVPEAAQQLLGQGGIPNTGLIQGGKITHIEMEHVWVEAWVDYFPSRAAKHQVGDQWIPLDASFKQYDFTQGYDLLNSVIPDVDVLTNTVVDSTTFNSIENSVQGLPEAPVNNFYQDYQSQLELFIESQAQNPTVEDVLGTKKLIIQEFQQLSAGLPYQLIARTNNYSSLPDGLRHKMRFTLQKSTDNSFYSVFDDLLTHEVSLPEIAGKLISVSYSPATQSDSDTILSFYPDNDAPEPDQLPTQIPGYLVDLNAELTIGETIIVGSSGVSLGTETNHKMELFAPNFGWSQTEATGSAGEYRALGISMIGVSSGQLSKLNEDIEQIRGVQSFVNTPNLATKHNLLGLVMQSNILGYFALNETMNNIQGTAAGIVEYRQPSYGYFHTTLTPSYFFGVPRSVEFSGFTMDVPYLRSQSYAKDNDNDSWVGYNRVKGYRASYLENWVPEQHFLDDVVNNEGGVSAVRLLGLANQQGQKIFTISAENSDQLSSITVDSAARSDILNAINAGKEVTIHQSPITYNGWSGSGYLVIDPETGAGGYLISGGKNGGGLVDGILAAVAGLLGYVDGSLNYLSKVDKVWFSENLKYLKGLARASALAGVLGLVASMANVVNGGATGWNAVGQVSTAVFAFAATVVLVSAVAAALAAAPLLAALASAAIAASIGLLTARFASLYF